MGSSSVSLVSYTGRCKTLKGDLNETQGDFKKTSRQSLNWDGPKVIHFSQHIKKNQTSKPKKEPIAYFFMADGSTLWSYVFEIQVKTHLGDLDFWQKSCADKNFTMIQWEM